MEELNQELAQRGKELEMVNHEMEMRTAEMHRLKEENEKLKKELEAREDRIIKAVSEKFRDEFKTMLETLESRIPKVGEVGGVGSSEKCLGGDGGVGGPCLGGATRQMVDPMGAVGGPNLLDFDEAGLGMGRLYSTLIIKGTKIKDDKVGDRVESRKKSSGKVESGAETSDRKTKKRKNKKAQLLLEKSKSQDSLYSESEETEETVTNTSEEDSDLEVNRTVLLRETPKISKFVIGGRKTIADFFDEYEKYCREKYGESRQFWAKNLGEFLSGRLAKCCETFQGDGDVKYDVVKQRVIATVERMKGSVRYRKKNDFVDARMGVNETVDMYAHRLETLARKKFGDEGINENKELLRKFIATVPEKVAARVNAKRKEISTYSKTRMKWNDVLELVEDERLDGSDDVYRVRINEDGNVNSKHSKSYRDMLCAPVDVMEEFLNEYYGTRKGNERGRSLSRDGRNVYVANDRSASRNRENGWITVGRRGQNGQHERSVSRGRSQSVNGRYNRGNGMNGNQRVQKCYRCDRPGHVMSNCRWKLGACFKCGKTDHKIKDCPEVGEVKCYECGELGHRASECRKNVNGRQIRCGNCGKVGHYARMCKAPVSKCGKCGTEGHATEVCRKNRGVSSGNTGLSQGNAD